MKLLLSLGASGKLSAAGDSIAQPVLSTVNGQLLGNLPTLGLSLRTGKLLAELGALELLRHELSFGMVIYCSTVDKESL